MSTDRSDRGEGFLSRWSRVKTEARDEAAAREALPAAQPAAAAPAKPEAETEPPALPPVDELTLDSDFSGFFHPKVDEGLRRAALRKLFSDPHFNVMDGLDVYIEDYSKGEPLPAAMLASLKQAQRIFEWAAQKNEPEPPENASAPQATPPASIEAAPVPQPDANVALSPGDLQTPAGKT